MESLNEFQKRKITEQFYEKHRQKGKSSNVKHFIEMGLKRGSIYNIINRIENIRPLKRPMVQAVKASK